MYICNHNANIHKMTYILRAIETAVLKASRQFPSLIITGPRQSGKTTLLKELFGNTHNYVSLDLPSERRIAEEEPELFFKNYPPPVIIDEIQYAPGLLSFIKQKIDSERSLKGQFLLTGSQYFPIMKGVSETLAGRIAVFSLLSLSMNERQRTTRKTIGSDWITGNYLKGGFPELTVDAQIETALWYNGYLQTYIERDIRQLRNIANLSLFHKFIEFFSSFFSNRNYISFFIFTIINCFVYIIN